MKTLVIGASKKPDRYSNKAMNMLRAKGYEVLALGNKAQNFDDWQIDEGKPEYKDVHTITLYLNPTRQKEYKEYIKSLKPQRVIFNPGTENPKLEEEFEQVGIATEQACTLVLLSTNQF